MLAQQDTTVQLAHLLQQHALLEHTALTLEDKQ